MRFCPSCGSTYTARIDFCGIDGSRLIERTDDPLVGKTVDRYEVLDVIGFGAMGCVYRVRHSVLEQVHAMKVLYGDLGADHTVVERFRREAKVISKIRHPNVVSVTDFGTAQGLTFLVMEYIEGRTLAEIISTEAPLRPTRAADIVRQIAAGLGEAHRLDFIHRDIKPSNIMISREGEIEYIKILDFGIVGAGRKQVDDHLTATGRVVGTPAYMSPEQAKNAERIGPASDFYSLGVNLYEMLEGRPPFTGESAVEIVIKHSTQSPPEIRPAGGLELLVHWLLEKNPKDRPESGAEIIAEIDRLSFSMRQSEPPAPRKSVDDIQTVEMEPDDGDDPPDPNWIFD